MHTISSHFLQDFNTEGTVSGNTMLEAFLQNRHTVLPEEGPLVVLQNLFYLVFDSHTSTGCGDYLYLSLTCLAV